MIKATKHLIEFELVTFGPKLPTGDFMRGTSCLVKLHSGKKLTIQTYHGDDKFIFKKSDQKTVAEVGRLLVEASKLADQYDKFMNEADLIKP